MYRFNYEAPTSIDGTLTALRQNSEAKIIAGGMTLLPTMKLRLASPDYLVDINNIHKICKIFR